MNNNEKGEHNFKEMVLRKVINLSLKGKLEEELESIPYNIIPDTKAKFRCCVYKEREIVRQRVRLACGKKPLDALHGENNDDIIHIISAACEECPISRYIVTENCQCCVSKRCKSVCHFGAISLHGKKAYIEKELCRECGKCKDACPFSAIADLVRPCVKSCPVDAIHMDSEKKAFIDNKKCVLCGRCVVQCPFGAISEASCVVDVINMLKGDKSVYAIIAPSLEAQYKNASLRQIKEALKAIGFKDVYEAAEGAEIIAVEEASVLKSNDAKQGFMASSCCPSFVKLIQNYYPKLSASISHSRSPMLETAKLIKDKYKDAFIVFISPCISKKLEIQQKNSQIDAILTFIELDLIFSAHDIKLQNIQCAENTDCDIHSGRGFAVSGGVIHAVKQAMKSIDSEFEIKAVQSNGIEECKANLALANAKKNNFNFIEGMSCKGGCIGGEFCITSADKAKKNFNPNGAIKNV